MIRPNYQLRRLPVVSPSAMIPIVPDKANEGFPSKLEYVVSSCVPIANVTSPPAMFVCNNLGSTEVVEAVITR